MHEEGQRQLRQPRREPLHVVFVGLRTFFVVFVVMPLSYAADLDNLPPAARAQIAPASVDWAQLQAQLQQATGDLREVSLESLWGTYLIESAKCGKLKADAVARVISENGWTADQVAAFWDRLDRETADRSRHPDVAGELLAGVEQCLHLKDAFGEGASIDALFGLAQMQLFARKLPEARAALEAVLARLPEKTEFLHASRGVTAYRIAQSYEFASDFEAAREWYLKCAEWGTPENTGGYDVRGEGYVEAARMCTRLGLDEEALTHYRKAIDECGQWGQAVASMDMCGLLMRSKQPEEAIAVLEPLSRGGNGPVAQVYALLSIARLRTDQGDTDAARAGCQQALEVLAGVTDAQALGMLASAGDQGRNLLSWIDRCDREPVAVRPAALLLPTGAEGSAPSGRFVVVTWVPGALVLAAPDWLIVEPQPEAVAEVVPIRRTYWATLKNGLTPDQREGEVVVSVAGHPDWMARLPVKVRSQGLDVSARECFFGFLEPGEKREQILTVRDRAGRPFSVTECRVDGPGVHCGESVRVGDSEWRVTVSVQPTVPGAIEARLLIVTDRHDPTGLVVPIHAYAMGD